MRIKLLVLAALLFTSPAIAMEGMGDMEHGGGIYHAFTLETDIGASNHGPVETWDLDGWFGGDDHKLWLKSEGTREDHHLEDAEFWALYSRNITTFWDAQGGIRYDTNPRGTAYAVVGFTGLAPQFFEVETHAFLSDDGKLSARLRAEHDLLLTQQLVAQPYGEINLGNGQVIHSTQLGLQTRYEFTRQFAPYVDLSYTRNTVDENTDTFVSSIGLRFLF